MLLVVWYFLLCSFSPSLYLALSLFRLFDFGFSAYLCIVVQLLFTRLFLSSNSYRLSGRGFSGVHVSVILKCWKSENCFWRRPNTLRTIWSGTSFTKHQTQCIYAMRIFGLRRFAKNCNDRPATASSQSGSQQKRCICSYSHSGTLSRSMDMGLVSINSHSFQPFML